MTRKRRGNGQGTLFKRNVRDPWIAAWYDHTDSAGSDRHERPTGRPAEAPSH